MADKSAHRFESNEVLRWAGDTWLTVNAVGDPGHGGNAEGFDSSVLLILHDGEEQVEITLDLDTPEAGRVVAALQRAIAGVNAAT